MSAVYPRSCLYMTRTFLLQQYLIRKLNYMASNMSKDEQNYYISKHIMHDPLEECIGRPNALGCPKCGAQTTQTPHFKPAPQYTGDIAATARLFNYIMSSWKSEDLRNLGRISAFSRTFFVNAVIEAHKLKMLRERRERTTR